MFGSGIASILDARTRFLKPGGWLVARRDTLWAALVSSPRLHDGLVRGWQIGHDFDFSRAQGRVLNAWRRAGISPEEILGEPQCWATLDYETLTGPNVSGQAVWTGCQEMRAHGVAIWFETETAPGIGFSNSPHTHESHIYRQGFFPWPKATEIRAGSEVSVRFRADSIRGDYIWTWDTRITGPHRRDVTAQYHQSTFLTTPISPRRLLKRAHSFVATPNGASTIDRRILDLMDQHVALGGIADVLVKEFPSQFSDWDAALTRAGDISDRYSE
jgi:protein arginine N-methyltransferase 1